MLLTDMIMPQLPGREVAALVQHGVPGHLHGGYSSEDLSARGLPADAAVLNKPIDIPALMKAVCTALEPPTRQA